MQAHLLHVFKALVKRESGWKTRSSVVTGERLRCTFLCFNGSGGLFGGRLVDGDRVVLLSLVLFVLKRPILGVQKASRIADTNRSDDFNFLDPRL